MSQINCLTTGMEMQENHGSNARADTPVEITVTEQDNQIYVVNRSILFQFWQLIGFFRRVFFFFSVYALSSQGIIYVPGIAITILQCFPIMTLTVIIFRKLNSLRRLWQHRYGFLIFSSLLITVLADLIVHVGAGDIVFAIGKILHVIAWILYITAFGWKPFATRLLFRSALVASLVYYYIYVGGLKNRFSLAVHILGGFYTAVLFAVQWRGWARVSYLDLLNGRWYEFIGAMGTSLLVLAEIIFFANRFFNLGYMLLAADYTFVAIYYTAQLCITLSVVDGTNIIYPQETTKEKRRVQRLKSSLGKPLTCIRESTIRLVDWVFA